MLHTITFSAPTGSTAKAIPADASIPFSHYTDYGIAATESVAQPGTFTIELDDSEYLQWWIFLGSSDPTASEDNHVVIDLSQGAMVERYDTDDEVDSFKLLAVTGSGTPAVAIADIGNATGSGNSRVWTWTAGGKTWTLQRRNYTGTTRWDISAPATFPNSYLYLGPTDTPFGDYNGSNFSTATTGTVTVDKKQIASKAWRYTSASLANFPVIAVTWDGGPVYIGGAVENPFTLSDAVARLASRAGVYDYGDGVVGELRKLTRACRDALRDIMHVYDWRYYNRAFRLSTEESIVVYVDYVASTGIATIDYTDDRSQDSNGDDIEWPENAADGELWIGDKTIEVSSRTSDTEIILSSGYSQDYSGEVTWVRSRYKLPSVRTVMSVTEETNSRTLKFIPFSRQLRHTIARQGVGTPTTYSIEGSSNRESLLSLSPVPSTACDYIVAAKVAPAPAIVFRDEVSVTASNGATTLTIANASSKWVGCVIRRAASGSTSVVEDIIYDEWEWEAYVTAVTGTTVFLSKALSRSATSETMIISSPLDIAVTAQSYYESLAFAVYCRNHKHDTLSEAMAVADRDLVLAKDADSMSGGQSASSGSGYPLIDIRSVRWEN